MVSYTIYQEITTRADPDDGKNGLRTGKIALALDGKFDLNVSIIIWLIICYVCIGCPRYVSRNTNTITFVMLFIFHLYKKKINTVILRFNRNVLRLFFLGTQHFKFRDLFCSLMKKLKVVNLSTRF